MNTRTYIPYLQVRSDCIVAYSLPELPHNRRHDLTKAANPYSGKMTNHSQRRVMRAVDLLLQRNPKRRIWNPVIEKEHDFQIGFCTLTIPASKPVPASFGHKYLLEPFLRTARRKWNVKDYVWKAELQNRGQLHYHITWSEFVHLTDIRNTWNSLLRKHRLSDEFAARFGHFHPNSTDIHAVWKVRNLKAYLAKYIAKVESGKAKLNGKVWDCSTELKRSPWNTIADGRHAAILDDGVAMGQVTKVALDQCTIYKMANPVGVLSQFERSQYESWLRN